MRGWHVGVGVCCGLGLGLFAYQRGCVSSRIATGTEPTRSAARPVPVGFLKGQLHAHTQNSDDSRTPPSRVHAWYESRGYDFVVFTDHNRITDTRDTTLLSFPGAELTQNRRDCKPPPASGEVCLLHVNALFVDPRKEVDTAAVDSEPDDRVSIYKHLLEHAKHLGGIPMLNHPNMQSGANAEVLEELAKNGGFALLEVLNQAHDARNAGDGTHASTERLWDSLLSMGYRVYATATDDAHHYDDVEETRALGEDVFAGDLGFVMVRSERDPIAIRDAIRRGDFYSSTGLILSELVLERREIRATLASGEARFEVIGSNGKILRTSFGARFVHPIESVDGYVRVRVVGRDGRLALTQPVFD